MLEQWVALAMASWRHTHIDLLQPKGFIRQVVVSPWWWMIS